MTDIDTAVTSDQRLADFAERLRRMIAGEPDEHADAWVADVRAETGEAWRFDWRAERLDGLHHDLGEIVSAMREAHYASLPQSVRDADAAAARAAQAKWKQRLREVEAEPAAA